MLRGVMNDWARCQRLFLARSGKEHVLIIARGIRSQSLREMTRPMLENRFSAVYILSG